MMGLEDKKYMSIALKLAEKGNTSPNPKVGAVIVKDGKIIGKGYHKKAGMPHAEIEAIRDVKDKRKLKGATLYVSLEPCSHHGKTPPCTDAIIRAGIGRVVYAMHDPNPRVNGEKLLRKKGIRVRGGLMGKQAEELNRPFIKFISTGTPYVCWKTGMSGNGKITYGDSRKKWITGMPARKYGHMLRAENDVILVGIGTVLKDDPVLDARMAKGRDPVKVICDSELRIPRNARVLGKGRVILATTDNGYRNRKKLRGKNIEVIRCGKGMVDLKRLMRELGKMGISSVLIEGGAGISASALRQGIIDKYYFFISPKIIPEGLPVFNGIDVGKVMGRMKVLETRKLGKDMLVVGTLKGNPKKVL